MASPTRFEALALPHLTAAYNLAFWILRSRDDAQDVVQEAYLRAFQGFSDWRGEDIRPWLFTIVRNAAYRSIGTQRRAGNVVALDAAPTDRGSAEQRAREYPDGGPNQEDVLIAEAERAQVLAALADLPAVYREVVTLREIEGLGYREIAEITGTVVGTVMSRLSRGRRELRSRLTGLTERDGTNDR